MGAPAENETPGGPTHRRPPLVTASVNYEYWPNGQHGGLNQVLLTPGLILGRFKIGQDTATRPVNLIFGAGYQVAVTSNPVIKNNFVATLRITF